MPFKMHKIIYFIQKRNNLKKRIVCAYPTYNFQTRYPNHTYFLFGLNYQIFFIERVENIRIFTRRNIFCIYRKKSKFSFYFVLLKATCNVSPTEKEVLKMQKRKHLANQINFNTKIFVKFYLRKCIPTIDVFVHK